MEGLPSAVLESMCGLIAFGKIWKGEIGYLWSSLSSHVKVRTLFTARVSYTLLDETMARDQIQGRGPANPPTLFFKNIFHVAIYSKTPSKK